MFSAKHKNVELRVKCNKSLPGVVVAVAFDAKVSCCTFNRAMGRACCADCFTKGSEEAILAAALYNNVCLALTGDVRANDSSKVSRVEANCLGDQITFSWSVKNNLSAVRKSLGLAIKALQPAKVFRDYSWICKKIDCKVNKSFFLHAVKTIADSLKKSIKCIVVGKLNVTKEKVDEATEVLSGKFVLNTVSGAENPTGHTDCKMDGLTFKCGGWKCCVLADFIRAKVGVCPVIYPSEIYLGDKKNLKDAISKKLKGQLSVYVNSKFGKYSDLGDRLAALYLSKGCISVDDATAVVKANPSAKQIETDLKKLL